MLIEQGILKTDDIIKAFDKVDRSLFMPEKYKKYANIDEPFPIPPFDGKHTISAPHTYAIYYELLQLKSGESFLEIGSGSGYGLVLAKEIIGKGKVIGIENNKITFDFCKKNLEKAGYKDVIVINDDGKKGCVQYMPYDKIAVTAAAKEIPIHLLKQLKNGGSMVIPLGSGEIQELVFIEKQNKITKTPVTFVRYVPLD
ncbi:MAG: protein-L-isoaspartate O-methyltransferase [Candidatus Aenigmatarchaeota archaeon]|nr:protein-L-isoaspartate O-methyltransferase [Candidatus Aenigmarchaeota archaeon]